MEFGRTVEEKHLDGKAGIPGTKRSVTLSPMVMDSNRTCTVKQRCQASGIDRSKQIGTIGNHIQSMGETRCSSVQPRQSDGQVDPMYFVVSMILMGFGKGKPPDPKGAISSGKDHGQNDALFGTTEANRCVSRALLFLPENDICRIHPTIHQRGIGSD